MITGNPVSKGIAIGSAYIYKPYVADVIQNDITFDHVEENCMLFDRIREKVKTELDTIRQSMERNNKDQAKIIAAQIDILFDEEMEEEIKNAVKSDLVRLDWAIYSVFHKYCELLSKVPDQRMRERTADLKDVCHRMLRVYNDIPEQNLSQLSQPVVLVAEDLFPSDTAMLDRDRILAIVTEKGGSTSHTAIIAKSYEIPALLAVKDVVSILQDGQTVIVDAVKGELHTQVTVEIREKYARLQSAYMEERKETQQYLSKRCTTACGERVDILLNIGSANDQELEAKNFADGVGLFRSEFLYMGRYSLPSEEEQYEIYKKILLAFQGKPVTLRTLDIGGDKKVDSLTLESEENPFLGNRGIRLCFSYPDVFETQLRAAIRASEYGNLELMLPMVSSLDDIRKAKTIIRQIELEVMAEYPSLSPSYSLGVMIETPSLAMMADHVAREVDFASIGTNDLGQYALAVDRMNERVSEYYQPYHPALIRMLYSIIKQFKQADKPISVCGELGGDPLFVPALVGMGIRKLSMAASSLAPVKKVISNMEIVRAESMVQKLIQCQTHKEALAILEEFPNND